MTVPETPASNLAGKTALITGATSGIGFAAAAALARAGAKSVIVGRAADRCAEAEAALVGAGLAAVAVPGDITDDAFIADLIARRGPFHVLVNSAGASRNVPFDQVTRADYDLVMDINVRAALLLSIAVVQDLAARSLGGSIITISSQMGHVGGPNRSVYCASKHAVEGFSKALAIELAPKDIRVNTICPTFVETPMTKGALDNPEFRNWVLGNIPLGRMAGIEDVMAATVFLAGDGARMITGTSIRIDGGWTAQ
jgi:NAD(P)-dependent dehydrogenase (short-subunit alcohol dehydrogenase family)